MTLDGSDLAILIPLWKRTENIHRVYESARVATPQARIVLIVSAEDAAVWNALYERPDLTSSEWVRCVSVPGRGGERGDYASKINAGYRATSEPVLFTAADDLQFTPGWYDAARPLLDTPDNVVLQRWPNGATLEGPEYVPRIGVVGTNDLANPRTMSGEHSTHTLVARWYAKQGGSADQGDMIYHEGYWHEYCDDELVQTAKAREAWAHAADAHVEHLHPIVGPHAGTVPDDEVYRHGRAYSRESQRIFRQRSWLWGGEQTQHRTFRGIR